MQSEQELRATLSQEFKSVYNDEKSLYKTCFGDILPIKTQSQLIDWNIEIFEQPGLHHKYSVDLSQPDANSDRMNNQKPQTDQEFYNRGHKSQQIQASPVLIGSLHYMLKTNSKNKKNEISYQLPTLNQGINQPLLASQYFDDKSIQASKDEEQKNSFKQTTNKIQPNRLIKIKGSQKREEKKKKVQWTWDTSAALIRLMIRSRRMRIFTNFYIWALLGLRVFYVMIILLFLIKNVDQLHNFTYFWTVFIVFVSIRIFFMLIVLKILTQGYKTNDQKIRIVYETYIQILDQYRRQIESLKDKNQSAANKIRIRMYIRQILIIATPPELSFIYVTINNKMQSGFYQVQNFLMKSLEVFFFIPLVIYFLNTEDLPRWGKATMLIVYIDLFIFGAFVVHLLCNNQRRITKQDSGHFIN